MERCVRSRLAKAVLGTVYSMAVIGMFILDTVCFGGGWLGGLELAVLLVLFGSVWLGWALKRWKWALRGAGGAGAITMSAYVWGKVVHPGQVMVDYGGPYLLGLAVLPFVAGFLYPGKWYVKLGFTVMGLLVECITLVVVGFVAIALTGLPVD
jgi:hypothetical protein